VLAEPLVENGLIPSLRLNSIHSVHYGFVLSEPAGPRFYSWALQQGTEAVLGAASIIHVPVFCIIQETRIAFRRYWTSAGRAAGVQRRLLSPRSPRVRSCAPETYYPKVWSVPPAPDCWRGRVRKGQAGFAYAVGRGGCCKADTKGEYRFGCTDE
jgi:hypothetical protein